MMRFCPNCRTERSLQEFYCEGTIDGHRCQWDLSLEPLRNPGDRPREVVTVEEEVLQCN